MLFFPNPILPYAFCAKVFIGRTEDPKVLQIRFQYNDLRKHIHLCLHEKDSLIELEDDGRYYLPEQAPVYDDIHHQDYICDSTFGGKHLAIGFEAGTKSRIYVAIQNANDIDILTLFNHEEQRCYFK